MSEAPSVERYDRMTYRRCGQSGLRLPVISLGLWQNFGHDRPMEVKRGIVSAAFDLGITHFDLANNYGPPAGAAEETLGRILATDLRAHRDELVVATKAGYDMWPGPYGTGGSRKYLLASLDQSLERLGIDYVDIFYSHCPDPEVPIVETMSALETAVRQGKAVYAGISSYDVGQRRAAAEALTQLSTPLLIHQTEYSMFNRSVERSGLLETLAELGAGCIGFMPLAQGLLTDRYFDGIPSGSRASRDDTLRAGIVKDVVAAVRPLAAVAARRGQSLAQMAIAWTLREPRMASTLVGVSSVDQLAANVDALDNIEFADAELEEIDRLTGG